MKIMIYYPPGCYGYFIEWLINWVQGDDTALPMTKQGSMHDIENPPYMQDASDWRNAFRPAIDMEIVKKRLEFYDPTSSQPFITVSHTCFLGNQRQELTELSELFDLVITVYFDDSDWMWTLNNMVTKNVPEHTVPFFKQAWGDRYEENLKQLPPSQHRIFLDLDDKVRSILEQDNVDISPWERASVWELDRWQLREILSYRQDAIDFHRVHPIERDNILYINIRELVDDFAGVLKKLALGSEVKRSQQEIEDLYQEWFPKQVHFNKDQRIDQWVNNIIQKESVEFNNLTLLDEALIQKKLREQGWDMECYGLDQFPDSTDLVNVFKINN